MTVHYNPDEFYFKTMLKWRGTMLPLVLGKPTFWGLLVVWRQIRSTQPISNELHAMRR